MHVDIKQVGSFDALGIPRERSSDSRQDNSLDSVEVEGGFIQLEEELSVLVHLMII